MKQTKKLQPVVPVGNDKDEKIKAINTAISQIERNFGSGAIMRLGENTHMARWGLTLLSASAVSRAEE